MNGSPRELLEFFARSDNRVTLLMALTPGASVTRAELQTETGIPRSTVSRILDEFINVGLVSKMNSRYKVRPFGGFVAERLHAICDSIGAMQELQRLLKQLSDIDTEIAFTDQTRFEILTPRSSDPGAPTRRFADLLHAASHVRLLIPGPIAVLLDEECAMGNRMQTCEIVVPHNVFGVKNGGSILMSNLRGTMSSEDMTLFAYEGGIPYVAGTTDEIAIIGLINDAGTIRGYIETSDESVHSRTEAIIDAYQQKAARVPN